MKNRKRIHRDPYAELSATMAEAIAHPSCPSIITNQVRNLMATIDVDTPSDERENAADLLFAVGQLLTDLTPVTSRRQKAAR